MRALPGGGLACTDVSTVHFEELISQRIAAKREESLEALRRFDPNRAREWLLNSFYPEHTAFIVLHGLLVSFYTFRPADAGFQRDHLHVHPNRQARRIGSETLRHLVSMADDLQMPVSPGALRNSPSNRFYQRQSFVQTGEDEWDITTLGNPVR